MSGFAVPFIRSALNYDTDKVSDATGIEFNDISLAQQHLEHEADINEIVRRFGLGQKMPEAVRLPTFGDFTDIGDFRSALDVVNAAQEQFMELPADIRFKFSNDPQNFLEFVENPANKEQMFDLGLAVRPKEPLIPLDVGEQIAKP